MPRLPIPGHDDGQWGGILNDFLDVEHNVDGTLKQTGSLASKASGSVRIIAGSGLNGGGDLTANRTFAVTFGATSGTVAEGDDARFDAGIQKTLVTAKGDIVAATAANTPARLGVGSSGQILTADSSAATGLQWADQPTDMSVYPLAGYGLVAATDSPQLFSGVSAVETGDTFITRLWVPANVAFSKIAMAIHTGGTYASSAVPNQLGLYDDDGTLLQVTPDDSSMWTQHDVWYVAGLPSVVAAQRAGRFVYVGFIVGGFNNVSPSWNTASNSVGLTFGITDARRRTLYGPSRTSLPATFDPTSFGQATNYIPLIGLAE